MGSLLWVLSNGTEDARRRASPILLGMAPERSIHRLAATLAVVKFSRRALPVALAGAAIALIGAVAIVAFAPVAAPAQVETRVRASITGYAQQLQLSTAAVYQRVPADQPGCSAAVARDGTVIWAAAAGLADLATKTPVTTKTRFDMASVSKQFTAQAILMLQREGKLSVQDPIGNYVDGLPDWGATITLDQLIHHTSRIPDYWVELDNVGIGFSDAADQATTLDAIRRETELDPGEGFDYSNSNYVLLAAVVERVSGQSLADFLKTRIFDPLHLDMVLAPTLHAPDIALSYDDDLSLQESGWTSYGHSGIISTPSELARWGDQYRQGDIIQKDFMDGEVYEAEGEYYAAAMDIETDGDLNHTGRMGGYITDFTVSKDRHLTIVVMCNGHASDRWGIADALWSIWRPGSVPPPRD
jgi:CubicO group peptidase (beta-lactamase class C family)